MLPVVHRNQCTTEDVLFRRMQRFNQDGPGRVGHRILMPELNHAWEAQIAMGEKHPKIEIVRQNDATVVRCIFQDHRILCRGIAKSGPVLRIMSILRQKCDPLRTQIHIDQNLHAAGRLISIS
jgi:hypothetical protein